MSSAVNSSRNNNVGQYFFIIENLPRQYTWQDLKDLIRREASHGIWTEMAFWPNGRTGEKGHARVKRKDEAGRLYQYLTMNPVEGKPLNVHLWDTSRDPPQFLHCNCTNTSLHSAQAYPTQGVEVRGMATARGWQIVSLQPAPSTAQSPYPTPPTSSYTATPTFQPANPQSQAQINQATAMQQTMAALANRQLSPQDPRYAYVQQYRYQQAAQAQTTQQTANQQAGRYATSNNGLPVNTNRGAMRTEYRGVFISGLNYKARIKDIQALFGKAGEITRCEMQRDSSSGKSKGKATIQYSSAAHAQQAISLFDQKTYMNMELRVRLDTEPTVVTLPTASQPSRSSQPVIVNGSQAV